MQLITEQSDIDKLGEKAVVLDVQRYAYQKHDGEWFIANNWEGVEDVRPPVLVAYAGE